MVDVREQEIQEINEYLDRFQSVSPDRILDWIEESMQFAFEVMSPEGRKFFFDTRRPPIDGWGTSTDPSGNS